METIFSMLKATFCFAKTDFLCAAFNKKIEMYSGLSNSKNNEMHKQFSL